MMTIHVYIYIFVYSTCVSNGDGDENAHKTMKLYILIITDEYQNAKKTKKKKPVCCVPKCGQKKCVHMKTINNLFLLFIIIIIFMNLLLPDVFNVQSSSTSTEFFFQCFPQTLK